MSNSFFELFLASIAGIGAFYLGQALYYEVSARIERRQREAWIEEWEDENWEKGL